MIPLTEKQHYHIALHHLGFRPFFLFGSLFAALLMLAWFFVLLEGFRFAADSTIGAINWHGHEMVYGYAMAVIAGFLLTAVRNWTSVQTLHGPGLLLLALLWLLARLMPFIAVPQALWLMALFDLGFNLWLCLALMQPVLKTRQWQQAGILVKVLLLAMSNALFYVGLLGGLDEGVRWSLYSGVYLIVSLILLMGRRVIPFFIERGVSYSVSLRNRLWLDRSSLVLMFAFWFLAVFTSYTKFSALLVLLLAVLHGLRLFDWYTPGIWKKPLLWVLYLGYGWLVLGFVLSGLALFELLDPKPALHALTYGGIGMVTIGMMARVAYGHTGRNVFEPPRYLGPLFALLFVGALLRVAGPLLDMSHYLLWIALSQWCWIVVFGVFTFFYTPLLIKPRVDGQYG